MIIFNEGNVPRVKLDNIGAIKKVEEKKHGRKSISYQLIQEFEELDFSDIAIYAAIYLASMKQKPYWTLEDLKDQLTNKTFIDEKLVPFLSKSKKFDKMKPVDKKKKAYEIAQNIVDNESEIIQTVNTYLVANSKNITLAHQLSKSQITQLLKIFTDVINTLKKIYDENDKEVTKLVNSIIWYTDSKNTTSSWLNVFIKDLSSTIVMTLQEIKNMKKEKGISEKEFALLNSLQKAFETYNSDLNEFHDLNILWPESDSDIKGLTGLKQYFNSLEKYRSEAKKIINQYIKRKDKLLNVSSDDEEENDQILDAAWKVKFDGVIRKAAKEVADAYRKTDITERSDVLIKKAKELLSSEKGLKKHMESFTYDPESELVKILTGAVENINILRGRPENEEI